MAPAEAVVNVVGPLNHTFNTANVAATDLTFAKPVLRVGSGGCGGGRSGNGQTHRVVIVAAITILLTFFVASAPGTFCVHQITYFCWLIFGILLKHSDDAAVCDPAELVVVAVCLN